MEITSKVMGYVDEALSIERQRNKSWATDDIVEDIKQELYVHLLENDDPECRANRKTRQYILYWVWTRFKNYLSQEQNRSRLTEEHADRIRSNTTPTLSNSVSGGPEEELIAEQALLARWRSLSPLLKRVARKTFFGYCEHPRKVARELHTTEAAINMARTRIKKHLFGASE